VSEHAWATGRVLQHAGSNTRWYVLVWLAPNRDLGPFAATNAAGNVGAEATAEAARRLIAHFEASSAAALRDDLWALAFAEGGARGCALGLPAWWGWPTRQPLPRAIQPDLHIAGSLPAMVWTQATAAAGAPSTAQGPSATQVVSAISRPSSSTAT
jgi:hypothetical protein